jgi:NAD(P)-dependent dehydrogenase (short-subunit alcohol dehydrogenase family)
MQPQDSVVVITGANRGIGKALVEAYLKRGVKKVYAAARQQAAVAELVALDKQRVIALEVDVTKPATLAAAAKAAHDANVLINNAGVLSFANILDASEESLRQDMEVNYFGLIATTKAFVPVIERSGGGSIANLLSVVSLASMPAIAGYNASKAAAFSITQAMRADLAARKIHVLGIFPGPIDTDMAKDLPMEKTPPAIVANEIIDGIAAGAEDVFPDPMSKQVAALWMSNPKGLEKQFGGM